MNQFGGNWTEMKIEMIVDYANAYLTIMNKYPQFEIIYFDGFAGSGDISTESKSADIESIKGAAVRILELNKPKSFDIYYFAWLIRLENFLGISRDNILKSFYKKQVYQSLFDNEQITLQVKETNSINKIHNLYKERLCTVIKYVSDAFVLRNSKNAVMYHFMMATNNPAALKIANDIVKPKFKI